MADDFPPVGSTVEVEYDVNCPRVEKRNAIMMEVVDHNPSSFVMGEHGIGTKVTSSGSVYSPTSSDGYHADGDTREKVGRNAEWEIVKEPDE